jgi:phage-related protein
VAFEPILKVVFFRNELGQEPVRIWLKALIREDRQRIGEAIKLLQFRWPLGMPLVRKIEANLWEIRSRLKDGQISRIFFTVERKEMVLLHGFIKYMVLSRNLRRPLKATWN